MTNGFAIHHMLRLTITQQVKVYESKSVSALSSHRSQHNSLPQTYSVN